MRNPPRKAAEGALAGFNPRKNKVTKVVNTNGTAAQDHDFDFNNDNSSGNQDSSSPFNGGLNGHFKPYDSYHEARAGDYEEYGRSNNIAAQRTNNVERSAGQQSLEEAESNGHWEYTNGGSRDDIMASGHTMGEHTWTTPSANDVNTSFEVRATPTSMGNQTDYPSERSFRIDKSKRYGHSSVQDRVGERPLTAQSSSSLSSPPASSLLNKFLSGSPEGNNVESGDGASTNQNRLQITQPAKTSILSGAGLEVVRMREENSPKDVLGKLENGIKRQASLLVDSADSRITKRPRAEESFVPQSESLRSSRPPAILIDVTNPDAERVSYSDEPEIEDSIRMKSSTSTTTNSKPVSTGATQKEANSWRGPGTREPYRPEEDELLCQLKADGLSWDEIVPHFNGRTKGSLQVRYSTKFAHRKETAAVARPGRKKSTLPIPTLERADSSDNVSTGRAKRARNTAPSAVDGFVSWASVKASRRESAALANPEEEKLADSPEPVLPDTSARQDGTFPASVSQVLRYRELGLNGRRFWGASPRAVRDDVKNHVYKTYTLQKQYHGTSGDVVALSWAPDGDRFAAGSIAISDDRSMQYNMQRNLVVGSCSQSKLREMTEHHIPRPLVDTTDNVNGLHAMRASQDPRLFKTVTATAFSPSSPRKLYTTGEDMMLRRYAVGTDLNAVKCRYEIQHPARVDLLAVSTPHGIVATGCHTDIKSVQLYRCHEKDYETGAVFSPSRRDLQSSVPIYPSTLKWGIAHRHCALLLAGFCGDEEKEHAGETCLWDVHAGTAIPIRGATRNVFDVAWNPNPSSASTSFAVASKPSSLSVARSTRSVIQCFAPNQQEARKVLTWECPAADINDVVFCPYDDNLIAAGATNGTVYIWDQRSADRSQNPLHILHHGATENILAHDRDPETADTGVRFLSWGATKTRLYSGSHDGIVKVWNPYRSPNNAHVDNIAPPRQERSAVMSGTFNQDHRELLVGTENGRINLFSIEANPVYKPQHFKLETAPSPAEQEQEDLLALARSMIDSGKIEIRPCGAMPFRQAVQGPNYEGPFMAPSSEEINKAEEKCNEAIIAQSDAHFRQAQLDPEDDAESARADSTAVAAQRTLDELNQRLEHFHFAQPKAAGFQRALFQAEQDREKLLSHLTEPVEACTLQCGVLPTSGDGVEDSRRSELRIPQMLRSIEQNAAVVSIGDEESVATCASCFPLLALKRKGKPSFCAACKLKKAGLTVSCSRCGGPARLQTDTEETLCERCSFTCFRCTGPVTFDDETNTISCSPCNLTWNIGVLGYELVTAAPERRSQHARVQQTQELEQYNDFGTLEREHYASLWQDTDAGADDMMG